MKGLPFVLAFTAMTFVAWGAYGPLLHHGTLSMGKDSLRAFVGVGIAYFFIAVLVPIYILRSQGETGKWTLTGTFYSLIAGSVGALGALGVILALAYGGAPIYVMPLVFGFAPIVNTLVTAWMSKTFDQISSIFILGIVVASLGVGGVLAFKPVAPPHAAPSASDPKSDEHEGEKSNEPENANEAEKSNEAEHSSVVPPSARRFVSTQTQQDPSGPDPLPPVVVQPPAPDDPAPDDPAPKDPAPKDPAPEAKAPQSEKPEPLTVPAQDLPPVVVQPSEPKIMSPAENTKPAAPSPDEITKSDKGIDAKLAKPEEYELPPTVVAPALPEQQSADSNAKPADTAVTPKVELSQPNEQAKNVDRANTPPKEEKLDVAKSGSEGNMRPHAQEVLVDDGVEVKPRGASAAPTVPAAPAPTVPAAPAPTVPAAPAPNVLMIIASIVIAAVCWGSYGPMLHQGQARMGGSRLRPFTCVGLAYFFIAVAAPLALIYARSADTGSWSIGGLSWSIIAGAAGAIGALGVILAFNAGGKPYYVMPLVFGFAPVINTCISLTENGTWGLVKPMFWISLGVVIAGAITVLLTAPKIKHTKPAI